MDLQIGDFLIYTKERLSFNGDMITEEKYGIVKRIYPFDDWFVTHEEQHVQVIKIKEIIDSCGSVEKAEYKYPEYFI